MLQSADKA